MLSSKSIRELIRERNLIDPVRDNGDFIEGSGYDLRIWKVFSPRVGSWNTPLIAAEIRKTPRLYEVIPGNLSYIIAPITNSCELLRRCHEENGRDDSEMFLPEEAISTLTVGWRLTPGVHYVAQTVEQLNIPDDVRCVLRPRTSYFTSGVTLDCSDASPGFSGNIRVGLICHNPEGIIIEQGAGIVTATFHRLDSGESDAYRGIWSGNKVETEGVERGS
jgi:deoxycytidine triphosphate deaminase